MTGTFQIGERHEDSDPMPDEILLELDLGDGVRANVRIRGERIDPQHVSHLRQYLSDVADLLSSHAQYTIDDGGDD